MNVAAEFLEAAARYHGDRPALVAGDRRRTFRPWLQALCREAIAPYKVPESVEFLPTLPKNPTGKILKKDLRLRH
ncbi:MAG: hypothetical protein HY294_09015 [Candidatus Rokubacteria bacterium]|nr:hypothetical protein [Candidatus Rokubacteria bacterium]MBI3826125.1 hypothetical protein [Candidatus Rokubacteria bacterium]